MTVEELGQRIGEIGGVANLMGISRESALAKLIQSLVDDVNRPDFTIDEDDTSESESESEPVESMGESLEDAFPGFDITITIKNRARD